MFSEWANRGLNLWTVNSATQALTDGTSSYLEIFYVKLFRFFETFYFRHFLTVLIEVNLRAK